MHSSKAARSAVTGGLTAAALVALALIGPAAAAGTASAGRQAGLGSFATWHGAQRAAGFGLLKPSATFGQRRNGTIAVSKCQVKHEFAKRLVIANYGLTARAMFSLNQNNSGRPCLRMTRMTRLGSVRVHGSRAALSGLCGRTGMPACGARRIWLFLTWTRHHVYYVASSFGEHRARLVRFARGLVRVR